MSHYVLIQFDSKDIADAFTANINRFQKSIEGQEDRWGVVGSGGKVIYEFGTGE